MNAPPEARSGAVALGHDRVAVLKQSAHEFILRRALGLAQSAQGVSNRYDFGRPAFPIEPERRCIQIVVQGRVSGSERQQRRGDLRAHIGDGGELFLRRFKSNDLYPQVSRRLGEKLVDLGQIERFALRFALGERGQDGQEPGLQVVREFGGVAETL